MRIYKIGNSYIKKDINFISYVSTVYIIFKLQLKLLITFIYFAIKKIKRITKNHNSEIILLIINVLKFHFFFL
jgi:hypothetical protein